MKQRIIIHNQFARALDAQEGKGVVSSLRAGAVLGSGERVTSVTRDAASGRYRVELSNGLYRRVVHWEGSAKIAVKDGVGSPEEVAYGEGWHSTENNNPYTSGAEKAAWEHGRSAKKLKFKLNSNAHRQGAPAPGMKRGVAFEPPKKKIADFKSEKGYVAKLINVETGGLLAKSEPHISNGPGLKKWIQDKARELIQKGKRVRAEVSMEFFDPNMVS